MFKIISAVYSRLNKMAELNDDVIKMADILNLNENLLCMIMSLIRGHFENLQINLFNVISESYSP